MPHQLVLNYLSSKTNFAFNQTLKTRLSEKDCRNDPFKLLRKTLLKELSANKGEIYIAIRQTLQKPKKTHGRIGQNKR